MKNMNGSGCVYKLSGKRRKPWAIRITSGYSLDGRQLRQSLGTFATKREAQETMMKYLKNP
ncbi:MAG: tyrosine-type recombinase/integrase, partial [Cetobacterium sp.]